MKNKKKFNQNYSLIKMLLLRFISTLDFFLRSMTTTWVTICMCMVRIKLHVQYEELKKNKVLNFFEISIES